MSAFSLYRMIMNVANVAKELETAGMRIEIGDDFAAYRLLRNAQLDRPAIYPMFDVASSYVDKSNAFWICGFNERDELVHTQAMRLLDLNGITLGQHMNTHRHKYITPNSTPDPDRTFYKRPLALEKITGKVVYHGEFWLKDGDDGKRKRGFPPLLARIAFEMALTTWVPNYCFGFIHTPLASKGMPYHYGYTHCEPGSWYGPDAQITDEDCIVWMNTKEMVHLLKTPAQALSDEREIPTLRSTVQPFSVVA